MKKPEFPEIIAICFILSVSCIGIFAVLDNSDNSYEVPEINNSSINDLKERYSYQDAKKECEASNGTLVNYSYDGNDSKIFVGCKL